MRKIKDDGEYKDNNAENKIYRVRKGRKVNEN